MNRVFEGLETNINQLLSHIEQLRLENQSLRTRLARSTKECYDLQTKSKAAMTKIKQIIAQLKENAS